MANRQQGWSRPQWPGIILSQELIIEDTGNGSALCPEFTCEVIRHPKEFLAPMFDLMRCGKADGGHYIPFHRIGNVCQDFVDFRNFEGSGLDNLGADGVGDNAGTDGLGLDDSG